MVYKLAESIFLSADLRSYFFATGLAGYWDTENLVADVQLFQDGQAICLLSFFAQL